MSISKLMSQPVTRIKEGSTIQEAVEINGQDIGIITAGDIISKVVAEKKNLESINVKEIMASPIVVADKRITGEEALRTMVKYDVRRLLITNNEEIVGIFTTSDITKLVLHDK